MVTLNQWLEESKRRALSEEALASLLRRGPSVLPPLLDAIHAGTRAQKANLSRVIARMRGAGVTTVLIPLLEDFEPDYTLPPDRQAQDRIDKARRWAERNAQAFAPGALYKYGHRYEASVVVKAKERHHG
jgi:hypothetical protein